VTLSRIISALAGSSDDAAFWRRTTAVIATTAAALLVAAAVAREPADFADRPVIAVLRDAGRHPAWAIRLARNAHLIAVDSLDPPAPPSGKAYQLWLVASGAAPPRALGLLPRSGRKIIAETPANTRLLAGKGALRVTLEPGSGALAGAPNGAPLFDANLAGLGQTGELTPLH
jgi:anti-sigma-K factor RskA